MSELAGHVDTAISAGRWAEALELLDGARDAGRSAEMLERRATAAYGAGDLEASVGAWEDQHALLVERGDATGAARAAAMVAMFLMIDTGLMAPVRGWLRRAEALLSDAPDHAVHALIAAVHTYERFMCGDLAGARHHAEDAIALGDRLGNTAAVVIGRTAAARITILEGRVDEGLAALDEVGAHLMTGAVDPLTTGMMLCEVVCAAQGLARHDIAAEWTTVMDHWRGGAAFGGLHGRCRVHRAEILRVTGPCDEAETEALGACDDLRPWMRREFGWPLAELGNIRLRRGDLDGAEEAFVAANEHVWCPHPGLALVHLARGDATTAMTLIDDSIEHPFRSPSKERPPFVDLTLAPLLDAQSEIAAALGEAHTARAAATRLRSIADTYRSAWLRASASLAEARAALLEGDHDLAVGLAAAAARTWAEIGAPYEAAVARTTLAEAHDRAGREATARVEREAAVAAFVRYGALGRANNMRQVLDGAAAVPDAHRRSSDAVFRLQGEIREISFGGASTSLRDLKGFRYLARMLAEPGREFHVLDLVAVEHGTLPTCDRPEIGGGELERGSRGGIAALDEQARAAYRRRLSEIDEEIEDARRRNDPGRVELAGRDREFLVAELTRAVGLGGRLRSVGSDTERARTAVARALRYGSDRLRTAIAPLADHLDNSLRTGTYCSYRPDPLATVVWSV